MVKIRLTRGGAKKRPFYHIIVTDVRRAPSRASCWTLHASTIGSARAHS